MDFQIVGKGKTILLIHGFLETSCMWEKWLDHSAHQFRFINITLPGHGGSGEWKEGMSISEVAEKMYTLFANDEPEWIVGHSLGGYIALELMLLFKNTKTVLLNSNYWEDSPLKKRERDRVVSVVHKNYSFFLNQAIPNLFMDSKKEECSKDIQRLIDRAKDFKKSSVINTLVAMRDRKDFSGKLDELHGRLYLISGEKDPLLKKEVFQSKIDDTFHENHWVLLKNTGHMSLMENPLLTIKSLDAVVRY